MGIDEVVNCLVGLSPFRGAWHFLPNNWPVVTSFIVYVGVQIWAIQNPFTSLRGFVVYGTAEYENDWNAAVHEGCCLGTVPHLSLRVAKDAVRFTAPAGNFLGRGFCRLTYLRMLVE